MELWLVGERRRNLEKNLLHRHFVHHKAHMTWTRTEPETMAHSKHINCKIIYYKFYVSSRLPNFWPLSIVSWRKLDNGWSPQTRYIIIKSLSRIYACAFYCNVKAAAVQLARYGVQVCTKGRTFGWTGCTFVIQEMFGALCWNMSSQMAGAAFTSIHHMLPNSKERRETR